MTTETKHEEGSRKLKAASFSVGVNLFLILLKSVVAVITGSIAILAELAHSVFDMLASVLAYVGIKKAEEPADKKHHFGHEKFENLSSLAQTILIVITSLLVIYEAVNRMFHPEEPKFIEIGLAIMVLTICIDFFISRYLHKASKKYESSALEADAYHFTTDLWGAIAVIVGLAFVLSGFPVFDSIAAIIVAILMLWISYKIGTKSINVLLDISPSGAVVERMYYIIKSTRGVRHFHNLKVRQAGNKIFVNIHVHVSPKITVGEGHAVAHEVKQRLVKEFPNIKEATIHVEPDMRGGEEEIE